MTIINDIVSTIISWLTPYSHIPQSTLLTVCVAFALSLISATVAKLVVNYDMIRSATQEFQHWKSQLDAARKKNDEKEVAKLMRLQQSVMKKQSRASMEQFKVMAVTYVPFLIIWYLLNTVFYGKVVAIAPFPIPIAGTNLPFIVWYLICSLATSLPITRLFGLGITQD